jgi:hypothetical protein
VKVLKDYHIAKDNIASQTLYITKNASIVAVADNDFDFTIVALCPAHELDTELRTFKVYSTYETIYEDNIQYLGTIGNQHIIEIL